MSSSAATCCSTVAMSFSKHRPGARRIIVCLLMLAAQPCSSKSVSLLALRRMKPFETKALEGPACMLDQASLEVTSNSAQQLRVRQGFLWAIPILSSMLALVSFKKMTQGFHQLMQALSKNTWVPQTDAELDLQTQVVTQVINGPVITSISVLFATLISTTVSALHERQMQIKNLFTKQIDELRLLHVILTQVPETLRQEARQYTHEYAERLVQDRHGEQISNALDRSLRELFLLLQNAMTKSDSPLLVMAHDAVTRIQQARCNRWMAMQVAFPVMHYVTLALLAMAICISFLVATDQSLVIFQSLQVRILWTILIGSFTSLAVVCYDLSSPFVGAYQVSTLLRFCYLSSGEYAVQPLINTLLSV